MVHLSYLFVFLVIIYLFIYLIIYLFITLTYYYLANYQMVSYFIYFLTRMQIKCNLQKINTNLHFYQIINLIRNKTNSQT